MTGSYVISQGWLRRSADRPVDRHFRSLARRTSFPPEATMLNLRAQRLAIRAALLVAVATSASAQKPRLFEVSGLPALNFDADEGFGYGVILALYGYEPGSTTYRWTVQPTVFLTTEGRRDYTLFFDSPSRAAHPWRFTAYGGREQQLAFPY